MKEVFMRSRLSLGFMAISVFTVIGCDDGLNRSMSWTPPSDEWALVASDDPSRYQWPFTSDGYRVERPPQMAYVTSFDARIACPDPVTAELVPWATEGQDEQFIRFLELRIWPDAWWIQTFNSF